MPLLVAAYIIAFIDRTNIGMAKESLETSIGLSAAAYGLGAGLFFVCYAVLEIPSNLIMHKVGARFWIARIMLTWGLISMAMAFVWNEGSFYVLRVLLGAAEAGLYPGIILYLSYWFTQKDRAKATGLFLLGVSLANVIGAPLAGALLRLHGLLGIEGWQWMFLIEGAPAVVLCWLVWYTLPNHPRDAKWLSPEDKNLLQRVIDAEDRGRASEHHDLRALLPVLRDPQIWLVVAIYFTHQIAVYSLSYFLPTMIKSYDASMSTMAVGLITALPWLAAAVGSTALPRYATSIGRARAFVSGGLVCVAGGLLSPGSRQTCGRPCAGSPSEPSCFSSSSRSCSPFRRTACPVPRQHRVSRLSTCAVWWADSSGRLYAVGSRPRPATSSPVCG
ncbi:MFS transporter [Actinomyces israelii]|uniref:MFS transporter n=1 Tax=Actinomyces israelii TaxID=1659 RepID=UPI002357AFFD|nr:MFS transporter [Actinomyces israelii]